MYNQQICIERITTLTKAKKLSINQMLKDANLPSTVVDNIKRGRVPSIDKLYSLADYFEVSIDFIVGRTDKPEVNR